ncbi:hypothetical protein WMF37_30705 [Sorangium sp. So ce291]|uniref:hypothetical protein n=1 Tax=Sorangium sp. So ce291 TaxID=3133294 RepID=UPI003F5EEAFA
MGLTACSASPPRAAPPPASPPGELAPAATTPDAASTGAAATPPAVMTPVPSSLPHATTPKELTIERAIAVGKSPVRVVVAGDTAWVTERGERRIAKVDLKRGNVVEHVEVGGPPIQIAAAPDGTIFALTPTYQAIWAFDPNTDRGRVFARFPDHPRDMVLADGALWVLLGSQGISMVHDDSDRASVVRIDLATQLQRRSPDLGSGTCKLAVGHGRVWVSRLGDTGVVISVFDQATLAKRNDLQIDSASTLRTGPGRRSASIAAGPGAVFVDNGTGVARVDPATDRITHAFALGGPMSVLQQSGEDLLAVPLSGGVSLLDPETLAVRAAMSRPAGKLAGRGVARYGSRLLVTEPAD